jgi:hypothetical protein
MSDLKAAAQQALEALETCDAEHPSDGGRQWYDAALVEPAITALKAALEQPEQAELDAYSYASRLAIAIWEKHYKATAVNWKPLPDLIGVLSQIDNMTPGLTHQQAQPEQDVPEKDCGNMEPVAWMYEGIRHDGTAHGPHLVWKTEYMDAMSANKGAKAVPLYTHPPRREWQGLTDEEIEDCWDGYLSDYQLQMIRTIEDKLKERNA